MGLCSVHKAWGFFQENFFKWNNGSKRHLFWTGRTIINHNNKTSLTVLLIKPSLILPALFFFLTSEMIFNLHIVFFWTRTTFLKSSIYAMKHRYSLFWLLLTTEIKTKTVSRGYNFSRISHKHGKLISQQGDPPKLPLQYDNSGKPDLKLSNFSIT